MKPLFITLISLLLTTANIFAQQNIAWVKEMHSVKQEYHAKLKSCSMPYISQMKYAHQEADKISINVSSFKELVLITDSGNDGISYDQAIWGDAKLITKEGNVVWLDEIEYEYGYAGWATPMKCIDADGRGLKIGTKEYEHGLFHHADGILVYDLSKYNFVRFEAEVGIDGYAPAGSVCFKVLNADPEKFVNERIGSELTNSYISNYGSATKWVFSTDESIVYNAVLNLIKEIKKPEFFKNNLDVIVNSPLNHEARNEALMSLYADIYWVNEVENGIEYINIEAIEKSIADMRTMEGFNCEYAETCFAELKDLIEHGFSDIYKNSIQVIQNGKRAIELQRNILLSNPLFDVDRLLVTRFNVGNADSRVMAPDLGTQANNWSDQQSAAKFGFDAEIVEYSNLREKPQGRIIYKPDNSASIADLRLHWDAKRALFTSVSDEKLWSVFEVDLESGKSRNLINCPDKDLEFFDATYLPDGRLVAMCNVGYQGVPCVNGTDAVGNMVLFDPKSNNIRRLTFDQDGNWNPSILPDGKIMYTRWEYTDLTHYFSRFVMYMNPDGTENRALFGSGSMFPNSTFDMRSLPGHHNSFIGIISGHHGIARSGRLVIFNPSKARTGVEGMVQEIPFSKRPIVEVIKDSLVQGVWPQFSRPCPLNDKYFLVSAKLSPKHRWGVYLVDIFDNVTPVLYNYGEGYMNATLVKSEKVPPVIPDRVNLADKEATVFIQDIYEGEGLRGVPRGVVKSLRIMSYEYAYLRSPSDHLAQGIQSGWDIKRVLGTVPVEKDGSAIFKVPANTPISLQPLDSMGRAIQWMRSWLTAMPGESVSCVGCHENMNSIPIPKRVIASTKVPSKIQQPDGGIHSVTFDLDVQPILDRNCISCHNGAENMPDFRGGVRESGLGFSTSYLALHPYIHRQGPEADMPVLKPYEYHSSTSELVQMIEEGHHGVQLDSIEWQSIYNWIDFNAPDKGSFNDNIVDVGLLKGVNQYERRIELADKYACGVSVDWREELRSYAEYLSQNKRPAKEPVSGKIVKAKEIKESKWPFVTTPIDTVKILELPNGVKMRFVLIPAGEFVMGENCAGGFSAPEFKAQIKKPFWMAEIEVTNEQYLAINPNHDSRYVDQFWKDHTHSGYPANLPEQPVIRVSWLDAVDYCKKLSELSGLNVKLPTETQWEWACRAGSDAPFWYGDFDSDFGKMENLADQSVSKMAVIGVDPKPMSENDFYYNYFNYVPRDSNVDDGNMIQTSSYKYLANPFGLYGMHGNIAEWTASSFNEYPLKRGEESSTMKVVRGGSYIDRPLNSTSYKRSRYEMWQAPFNVGFRVIIEE